MNAKIYVANNLVWGKIKNKKKKQKRRLTTCAPMQIQANRHDICSDISGEHVKPNLQHGEVTHGCESGGRAIVACGTASPPPPPPPSTPPPPISASLPPSVSVSRDLSQASLAVLPYLLTFLCPSLSATHTHTHTPVLPAWCVAGCAAFDTTMNSHGGDEEVNKRS